ncbi:MAG: DNA repair protein RecN [Acidobacteria bacterium]|nr:DNA repair protein RecN [Acidobacteriota bacterium]MBI3263124.1 DNA repair protein RecN [Acidobacteriota bacterium]
MLRYLKIRHLATIDALEIEFEPGLNVLTGETGAGKSILIEAVNLLLGSRASGELVRTGEDAADVQGIFERGDGAELIVRREITAQGRSRAFIDEGLVTAGGLRERIGPLIDLHGQHDHQLLLDPETHLDVLDAFGHLEHRRQQVSAAFERWRTLRTERDGCLRSERERSSMMDLLTFQAGEIDRAAPRPGEDEQLHAIRTVLANADKLSRLCSESYGLLYESDQSVISGLGVVWRRLGELAALDPRFAPYLESRDVVKSHLDELAGFLRSYVDEVDASPARLQQVEDRLAVLDRLKKKYGPSLPDVLARHAELRRELDGLAHADERAAALDGQVAHERNEYLSAASGLSDERRDAAGELASSVVRQLRDLAMERCRFEVRFTPEVAEETWSARGIDVAEFYLSPNPGEELRPLARIASGGELSRLMLALKTIASTDAPGKTLIFDEIDAGIGGRVADAVGSRLRRLGRDHQVLCISHLPQIAAFGTCHFNVTKEVRGQRTLTRAVRLDGGARVEELARMMAGASVSTDALRAARELLKAGVSEETAKGERRNRESEAHGRATATDPRPQQSRSIS